MSNPSVQMLCDIRTICLLDDDNPNHNIRQWSSMPHNSTNIYSSIVKCNQYIYIYIYIHTYIYTYPCIAHLNQPGMWANVQPDQLTTSDFASPAVFLKAHPRVVYPDWGMVYENGNAQCHSFSLAGWMRPRMPLDYGSIIGPLKP